MAELREVEIISPVPDPNEKLVKVFDTEQESEAMVVKGLLESSGIECNLTATATAPDYFPGLGGVVLMVREEDAETARRIIAENQRPVEPSLSAAESSSDDANDAEPEDDATQEIDAVTGKPQGRA